MRKFLLFALLSLSAMPIFAQNGAVTNAALYHKENQLDKAVVEINQAVLHEKTKNEPKTWYYRGLIYQSMVGSENPAVKQLSDKPEMEALLSYQKAIELDPKQGEYAKLSKQNLDALFPAFINKGYGEYNTLNFQKALESFEAAQIIRPNDTTGYIYAAFAAEELQRYDLIKNYISKLDQLNYKSIQVYIYKIQTAANLDKNLNQALEISRQALASYPVNLAILQEQTNLFIALGKTNEAIDNLNIMISKKPDDADYLAMLASLYDQKGENEKALKIYNQIIESDPENFIALYNSCVIFYEQGRKLNDEIHAMPMNDYHTKGKAKEAEVEEIFRKAMERAQKALTIAPSESDKVNINTLISQIKKVLAEEQQYKSLHKE